MTIINSSIKNEYITSNRIDNKKQENFQIKNTIIEEPAINIEHDKANISQIPYKDFDKELPLEFNINQDNPEATLNKLYKDREAIQNLITQTNDKNIQTLFKSFDSMIQNAIKMLELYLEYVNKVVIPKENQEKKEKYGL